MLVNAILLAALAVEAEESADRHPCLIVLVEEPAGVALHTQAPEPVPANRLSEAPPPRMVSPRRRSGIGATCWRCCCGGVVVVGGPAATDCVGVDYGYGCRGDGGARVEAALEIEAQDTVPVVHG